MKKEMGKIAIAFSELLLDASPQFEKYPFIIINGPSSLDLIDSLRPHYRRQEICVEFAYVPTPEPTTTLALEEVFHDQSSPLMNYATVYVTGLYNNTDISEHFVWVFKAKTVHASKCHSRNIVGIYNPETHRGSLMFVD